MTSLKPKETIVQNLKAAGCNPQMIENFLFYYDENQLFRLSDLSDRKIN